MQSLITGLAAFLVTFTLAHFAVLSALPGRIMSTVRERMMERGLAEHHWQLSERAAPKNQAVVRPSPDLAYAICLIDLSNGPVELAVPSWEAYGSLSVFSAQTDNVYAGSLDARVPGTPDVRRVVIALPDQDVSAAGKAELLRVKQPEVLSLIRRLAPTDEAFEAARALMPQSRCAPLGE